MSTLPHEMPDRESAIEREIAAQRVRNSQPEHQLRTHCCTHCGQRLLDGTAFSIYPARGYHLDDDGVWRPEPKAHKRFAQARRLIRDPTTAGADRVRLREKVAHGIGAFIEDNPRRHTHATNVPIDAFRLPVRVACPQCGGIARLT